MSIEYRHYSSHSEYPTDCPRPSNCAPSPSTSLNLPLTLGTGSAAGGISDSLPSTIPTLDGPTVVTTALAASSDTFEPSTNTTAVYTPTLSTNPQSTLFPSPTQNITYGLTSNQTSSLSQTLTTPNGNGSTSMTSDFFFGGTLSTKFPSSSTVYRPVTSLGTTASQPISGTTSSNSIQAASSTGKHHDHTGAIVGGAIGGLAFLLLAFVATILLCRRMHARRTAPSAEFMDLARGTAPTPARMEGMTTPSGDRLLPLARQGSLGDDDDRPPAFTPGIYADPVLEKVQAAAALREQYQRRDSYAAALADCKEPLGHAKVGHEDESTEVGTEEGYGLGWDEKAGYAWAM